MRVKREIDEKDGKKKKRFYRELIGIIRSYCKGLI